MSEKQKERTRIFLSYAAADREAARRVSDAFTGVANTRIFTTEMLSAGGDWRAKLREELTSSDAFVLLISREAMASNLVLQEFGAAWALTKPIVLVFLDPAPSIDIGSLPVSGDVLTTLEDFDHPDFIRHLLQRLNDPTHNAAAG